MKPFVLTVAIVTTNPSCIKTNREVHPSHESIKNFPKQPKQFQQAYNKMDFAEPNNQQHQLAEHVSYYLEMDHLNSMGKLSTEGNEAGNRRFKTEKNLHTFTGSVQIQMEQTLRFDISIRTINQKLFHVENVGVKTTLRQTESVHCIMYHRLV